MDAFREPCSPGFSAIDLAAAGYCFFALSSLLFPPFFRLFRKRSSQFIAARVLSGIAIGISSMICPVYIAEIAPAKWRGRLGALFQLGIVTGIFLTLFINRWIQKSGDAVWNTDYGWRWMLAGEAVPAFVFLLLLFPIPESPRWLIQVGTRREGPPNPRTGLAAVNMLRPK